MLLQSKLRETISTAQQHSGLVHYVIGGFLAEGLQLQLLFALVSLWCHVCHFDFHSLPDLTDWLGSDLTILSSESFLWFEAVDRCPQSFCC